MHFCDISDYANAQKYNVVRILSIFLFSAPYTWYFCTGGALSRRIKS